MINAVWSFRNCKGKISATDIILPLFSVVMWRSFHPEHRTKIYVDQDYFNKFNEYQILPFWDVVEILPQVEEINLSHFWSFSKFEVFQKEEGPFVHIDGDLIALSNLSKFGIFDYDVSVPLLEHIDGSEEYAYLDSKDAAKFGGLDKNRFEWDGYADNMSFVFVNSKEIKDEFLKIALPYIKEASQKEIDPKTLGYILFAEQKIFYELCREMNLNKKYLIKDVYSLTKGIFENKTNGEFGLTESHQHLIHYGPAKRILDIPFELEKHIKEFIIPSTGPFYAEFFERIYNKEIEQKS